MTDLTHPTLPYPNKLLLMPCQVTVCFRPSKSHKYAVASCSRMVQVLRARAILQWDRQVRATPPCHEVVVTYGDPLPAWVYEELRAFAPLPGGGQRELQRPAGRLAFSHPSENRASGRVGPILEVTNTQCPISRESVR